MRYHMLPGKAALFASALVLVGAALLALRLERRSQLRRTTADGGPMA